MSAKNERADSPREEHDQRRLLGGYLLGGLDEGDTDRLDAHLLDCAACRDEVERLAPVAELLRRLPEAARAGEEGAQPLISMSARPSAENVAGLLRRMRAERWRDTRRAGMRWLAAAAVVMVAAGVTTSVIRTSRQSAPPQVLPSPQLLTAQFEAAQGSGLTGEAVLTPKTWGVSVAINVAKLGGEGPYLCEVRGVGGKTEQAAMWGATPNGSAKVIGASSIQLHDVRSVRVADHDGHLLGTADVD